jgi:hypothetical protein
VLITTVLDINVRWLHTQKIGWNYKMLRFTLQCLCFYPTVKNLKLEINNDEFWRGIYVRKTTQTCNQWQVLKE